MARIAQSLVGVRYRDGDKEYVVKAATRTDDGFSFGCMRTDAGDGKVDDEQNKLRVLNQDEILPKLPEEYRASAATLSKRRMHNVQAIAAGRPGGPTPVAMAVAVGAGRRKRRRNQLAGLAGAGSLPALASLASLASLSSPAGSGMGLAGLQGANAAAAGSRPGMPGQPGQASVPAAAALLQAYLKYASAMNRPGDGMPPGVH